MDSEKFAAKARFTAELKGLNCNSKPIITSLTRLADEYIRFAPMIVECVENHLSQTKPELKLAVLYLIDSIVKNIKRDYVSLFSKNIVSNFTKTFDQLAKLNQVSKMKMLKLRNTWKDIFPDNKLYNIDCICKLTDPSWTVTPTPLVSRHSHTKRTSSKGTSSSATAHYGVTTTTSFPLPLTTSTLSFTTRPSSQNINFEPKNGVTELQEEVLIKQKQLLELQTQKLKLEVLQAQVQLEEKTREKSDFDSTYLTQVLLQQAETARQKTQIATSLLSGVVVPTLPTYNITPPKPILTTNVQMASTTTTTVPHEEIILGDSPTPSEATTIPSFSKHFSESSSHIQIEKNFKGETFTEAPLLPVSTKHDKPYYNGYDPSNIYDKTPDSGSVVAIRKPSSARLSSLNKSLSPETNKRKYNLKETHDEARGAESQVSFPHKQQLVVAKDVDDFNVCTNFEESFDRPARKEKIIETKKVISALKRSSATTFSTDQNSSSSELEQYKPDDTQASITIIDLDHPPSQKSFGVHHEGDPLLDVNTGTVNVNPVEFAPIIMADPHTIMPSSEYPPMKKQRKSQKQGEGFSPIHDLFGGEDVDLRPRQSSSSVQPSLSSSISTATILDGQKQHHHNKQQQFNNIPLAEDYDCPVPPADVDLSANVNTTKKVIAYEVVDVESQEKLPSASTSHLRDSDHRLLLSNQNTPNPSKQFIGIHLDQQEQKQHNAGRLPSLISMPLPDEIRQNQSWNQNQSYPMIKPTGHPGMLSNQYNNGINMSSAGAGAVPGHGPGTGPVTGVESLLINPWVESKGGNVWNTLGPADSPYGHGGGPSNRFPVAGWNQNQTQAPSSGSGPPLSTNAWLPCPQPVGPNPFEEALSQPQIQIPSRGFPDFFIPPVNMAEYEIVAKDISGTVPIDGVLRKVRFYGETAVVVQGVNGDEPREISFRTEEPRNVYIDNEREPVICFFGKSSSFFLNRKQHFIKLGAPTREIYIDGDHYEASFGGDPIFVRSDSGMHSIKLAGPPPKVLVGQTLRNDLVAGRLNLFLDGHRLEIYLDDKPQAYELPGNNYPLILRFCDGFNTLKMNGRPFPTNFGGPPITITVPGGSRHQINISALNDSTRNTMSRYLQSQTSQEHSQTNNKIQNHLPSVPLIPCNSTTVKDTAFELDSNVPMSERVTPPLILPDKNDTNPVTTSDTVCPSHDSTKNPSITETSGSSKTKADTQNNITNSMTDPGARFSLGGNVNVHDLLLKLKVAGLLPTTTTATPTTLVADGPYKTVSANPEIVARESQTEKTETLTLKSNNSTKCDDVSVLKSKKCSLQQQRFSAGKIHSKKNAMKQEIKIFPLGVVDLDFTQLKYRIPSMVAQIWTGTQCSSCGLRFHPDQSQKFSEHLDWHFRHNRRIKARGKKICRRQFYYKMSDWMQYSQFEELEERARSMFEVEADELARNEKRENEGNVSWMNPDLHTTPCSGNEGTLCPQCGEGFETYFDEDKEEWRFKEACLSYDGEEENHIRRIYHILCYKDLLASLEGKSLLSYVVTASNEIESQQLQPALTTKDDPDEIVILKEGKKEVEVMDVVDIDVEGDSRKVPVSHRPSSAKAADAVICLGAKGEVDDVMEIVEGEESQVPVAVTVSSSVEAMDVSDNVSEEPKSLSQSVVRKEADTEQEMLSIKNVNSHEAEAVTSSNSKITSSNQVVVSKVNDNVQSDKAEMGIGSEKHTTSCVILNNEPGPKLPASCPNLIQEAEITSIIRKENSGIVETCVSLTEHANPNVSDSASTNLPIQICQPAIVIEPTVEMTKTQESSENPVSTSQGNISIVKIDLTDDDDDVVEVSSTPSTSHILSTIEGNIPLNGHTPLINKVVSSGSIRIRIQDALLNEDRSRTLKSTGGSLSLPVSGVSSASDIITLGDSKEDENSSKCLEEGQVERSKNTGVESSTKPKTSNNSHVSIVCTKGTDDVDVIEEPVINTSDSSRNKSKSFPRTNFTDCPVTISGKEISGLCVIS